MATGDIKTISVESHAGGMTYVQATIEGFTTGATYNFGYGTGNVPSSSTPYLTVVSLGYDATGAATTVSRTVYLTKVMRKAYPDEASNDETVSGSDIIVKFALSDEIYSKDKTGVGNSGTSPTITVPAGFVTNTGGAAQTSNALSAAAVTNNSTLAYPKVVARWVSVPFQRITGDATVECQAFSIHARNGKPVACVLFDAADEHSHSATQIAVTAMTLSTWSHASSIKAPVYAATPVLSSMTALDQVTYRFRAYPWIGDSGSIADSQSGITPPDERLCPLPMLYDPSNTYHVTYSCVDPAASDVRTAAAAFTTEAAARAAPTKYLIGAGSAIRAFNLANYGRDDAGGGVILLAAASHDGTGYEDPGSRECWLTVRPDTGGGVTRAQAIIARGFNNPIAGFYRFQNVTFNSADNGVLAGTSTSSSCLWLDSCAMVSLGGSAPIYAYQCVYMTDCTVTSWALGLNFYSTNKMGAALVRGNVADPPIPATFYCATANSGIVCGFIESGNAQSMQPSDNAIYSFNKNLTSTSTTSFTEYAKTSTISTGIAIVGNAIRNTSSGTMIGAVAGDNAASDVDGVIIANNSLASSTGTPDPDSRLNLGYNDSGTTAYKRRSWGIRNNVMAYANKDDTFGTPSAARTGAWTVGHMLNCYGNALRDAAGFLPEFDGLYTKMGATYGYTNTATGDLTPGATSDALLRTPAGLVNVPYDLNGRRLSTDSTYKAAVGAIQPAPTIRFTIGAGTYADNDTANAVAGSLSVDIDLSNYTDGAAMEIVSAAVSGSLSGLSGGTGITQGTTEVTATFTAAAGTGTLTLTDSAGTEYTLDFNVSAASTSSYGRSATIRNRFRRRI